jgi:hypothetical protein
MAYPPGAARSWNRFAILLQASLFLGGCAGPFETIDRRLAFEARLALRQERPPRPIEDEEEEASRSMEEAQPRRSVVVGELLAIFPGFLWHGLGHQYAGDNQTAKQIREAGSWGYLLTVLGAGLATGGYFIDKETDPRFNSYAISLYAAGGVTGGIGVAFFLTAWFYDMIDTPRAVEAGGRPPPKGTLFNKEDEEFDKR